MRSLESTSWDDIPADEQEKLILSLGRGPSYWPTDEELNDLYEQWYRSMCTYGWFAS